MYIHIYIQKFLNYLIILWRSSRFKLLLHGKGHAALEATAGRQLCSLLISLQVVFKSSKYQKYSFQKNVFPGFMLHRSPIYA